MGDGSGNNYLEGTFNKRYSKKKNAAAANIKRFNGLRVNGGSEARLLVSSYLQNMFDLFQHAYLTRGNRWKAYHLKIHVLPTHMQHHDPDLAMDGRRLMRLVHYEINRSNKSYGGFYRITLERDVKNNGGYHYHVALIAKNIKDHIAIETSFRNIKNKHAEYNNATLDIIAPDLKRVSNEYDRSYFLTLGVSFDGSKKYLDLSNDVDFEYGFYWFSYHCKYATKESLIGNKKFIVNSGTSIPEPKIKKPNKKNIQDICISLDSIRRMDEVGLNALDKYLDEIKHTLSCD